MRIKIPLQMKFFYLTICIVVVYLFLFYLMSAAWLFRSGNGSFKTKDSVSVSVIVPLVVVHLDLKGAPPKLEYMATVLPVLKKYGANALLMEYEDMFPYEGKLGNLSAANHYGKYELRNFLTQATSLGFEVIPLVQTFGHLEFALKLKEFLHLREEPMFPDSICPSQLETGPFIRHMLEQVITFHQSVAPLKYIHVGCDEVFHVKKCDRCRHRNETKTDILLHHIRRTADSVKALSPNTTVLIWDDILQTHDPMFLDAIDLRAEPVSWCYRRKLDVSVVNFYRYPPNVKNVWVASAFKGADGRTSVVPDLDSRFENNFSWMKLVLDYTVVKDSVLVNRDFDIKGIILTGWSRYSHMDPLCDIFPASMPSLLGNLIMISKIHEGIEWNDMNTDWNSFFRKYVEPELFNVLGCNINDTEDDYEPCRFREADVFGTVKEYDRVKHKIIETFSDDKENLLALDYYYEKGIINMNNINIHYFQCNDLLQKLTRVEKKLNKILPNYLDNETVDEYVNYLTEYLKKLLSNEMKSIEQYVKIRYWQRRPRRKNKNVT